MRTLVALAVALAATLNAALAEVLIVADEFPAMEVIAAKLKTEERITSRIVSQTQMPAELSDFQAVMVYIHKDLTTDAEDAFINYANGGGKLVLLHHSISSAKRKNAHWFSFLGVSLPEGDVSKGGYKWIEGVTFDLVNLNPNHFIMTNQARYPEQIPYVTTNAQPRDGSLPGFTLDETEVYLNHVYSGPRTLLMGLRYTNATTGVTYMQDTAGWMKRAGKGWLVYLMPGHARHDFENPVYGRIVLNAVIYQP
jgi:hypothetical protein